MNGGGGATSPVVIERRAKPSNDRRQLIHPGDDTDRLISSKTPSTTRQHHHHHPPPPTDPSAEDPLFKSFSRLSSPLPLLLFCGSPIHKPTSSSHFPFRPAAEKRKLTRLLSLRSLAHAHRSASSRSTSARPKLTAPPPTATLRNSYSWGTAAPSAPLALPAAEVLYTSSRISTPNRDLHLTSRSGSGRFLRTGTPGKRAGSCLRSFGIS